MELKEFIKDTVTQIADAVTELNGGTSKFNLVVNPIVSIGGINKGTLHTPRHSHSSFLLKTNDLQRIPV